MVAGWPLDYVLWSQFSNLFENENNSNLSLKAWINLCVNRGDWGTFGHYLSLKAWINMCFNRGVLGTLRQGVP